MSLRLPWCNSQYSRIARSSSVTDTSPFKFSPATEQAEKPQITVFCPVPRRNYISVRLVNKPLTSTFLLLRRLQSCFNNLPHWLQSTPSCLLPWKNLLILHFREKLFPQCLKLELRDTDPSHPGVRNSHSHKTASQATPCRRGRKSTVQAPKCNPSQFKAHQWEKGQNNSIINLFQKFTLFLCLEGQKFASCLQDRILLLPTGFTSSSQHKHYCPRNALISSSTTRNLVNKQIPQRGNKSLLNPQTTWTYNSYEQKLLYVPKMLFIYSTTTITRTCSRNLGTSHAAWNWFWHKRSLEHR